jgi:hypothetical protein
MLPRLPPAVAQALTVLRWSETEARLVLDAVAASGLTIADFARGYRVQAQRLYVWQRRLARATSTPSTVPAPPVRFVEMHGAAPAALRPSRVELVWPAGPVVRVEGPVDEDTLRTVLRVLREAAPC